MPDEMNKREVILTIREYENRSQCQMASASPTSTRAAACI